MNTTEILNKSLTWLNTKERKPKSAGKDITNLLLATHSFSPCQRGGAALREKSAHIPSFGYDVKYSGQTTEPGGIVPVAPQELYILTQVILHTLNTEPERYHHMAALPGLESWDWHQLGQVARYLLKQGWIEAKAIRTGFLIKLTIAGKLYVANHSAWV